jgi:alpha-L-arabinofuranosidase
MLLSVATVNAETVIRDVPSDLLGVNTAPWDGQISSAATLSLSEAAGLDAVRIGGGSTADTWHFNSTSNSQSIGQMADYVANLDATGIVTVDYGEGSPQEAVALWAYLDGSPTDNYNIGTGEYYNTSTKKWTTASWGTVGYWASLRAGTNVASNSLGANHAASFNIQYFEIGNEIYGSWEADEHGISSDTLPMPTGDTRKAHDPATIVSFSVQFQDEINAILADGSESGAQPISIGIDSQAVDSSFSNWIVGVLQQSVAQGLDLGYIADHYYAQSPGGESDSNLLGISNTTSGSSNPYDWTQRANDYDTLFHEYDPGQNIQLIADEVNSVSSNPGKQPTSIVNGLFIADSLGAVLDTTGTDSLGGYDGFWIWDLHNGSVNGNTSASLYGWREYGDYGIIGNGSGASLNELSPDYFAMQLASKIIQPGGVVVSAGEDNEANLDTYAVLESNGDLDLLIVNKTNPNSGTPPNNVPDPTLTEQFNISGFAASGQATVWQYGVTEDDAQANSPNGAASLTNFDTTLSINAGSFSYAVPDYSMMVIDLKPQAAGLTVTQAAAADPNPVTGASTALSARGSENGSGAGLTYTWAATGPASVSYTGSANGTNAAQNITAIFTQAGSYNFTVTIADSENQSVQSSVDVTVQQTPTGVMVSPSSVTVTGGSQQPFSASATDQFGNAISSPTFTWSITGTSDGNSIDSAGLATLGETPGTYTVTAQLGSASGMAQVTDVIAPTVTGFRINDGSNQRSMIDSLTLTFNEAVNLGGGAITLNLLSQTGGSPTPMSFTQSTSDGGATWVLTFTDPSYIGGSLPDGAYQLTVSASGVSGVQGGLNMASDQSYEFIRLYGDFNGDGAVNSADFGTFAAAFGHSVNSSNWYLDYDGNGVVNSEDFGAFAPNFGHSISIPSVVTPSETLLTATTMPPTPTPKSTFVAATPAAPLTISTTPVETSSPDSLLLDASTPSKKPGKKFSHRGHH